MTRLGPFLLILALSLASCAAPDPCEDSDDWQCRQHFCWTLTDYRIPICEPGDALVYNPYNYCLIETNGPGDDQCGRWYGPDLGGEWSAR